MSRHTRTPPAAAAAASSPWLMVPAPAALASSSSPPSPPLPSRGCGSVAASLASAVAAVNRYLCRSTSAVGTMFPMLHGRHLCSHMRVLWNQLRMLYTSGLGSGSGSGSGSSHEGTGASRSHSALDYSHPRGTSRRWFELQGHELSPHYRHSQQGPYQAERRPCLPNLNSKMSSRIQPAPDLI